LPVHFDKDYIFLTNNSSAPALPFTVFHASVEHQIIRENSQADKVWEHLTCICLLRKMPEQKKRIQDQQFTALGFS
jgi:hypothetical protein